MSCESIGYIEKLRECDLYINEKGKIPRQLYSVLSNMSQMGYNSLYSNWIKNESKGSDPKILKETQRCIDHIISNLHVLKRNI
jgi:hypothetical protein